MVSSLQSGKRTGGEFIDLTVSPKGEWLYCLGQDGTVYCFATAAGKLEHLLQVTSGMPIGLQHHPQRNLLATWADDGLCKLWVP